MQPLRILTLIITGVFLGSRIGVHDWLFPPGGGESLIDCGSAHMLFPLDYNYPLFEVAFRNPTTYPFKTLTI